ncbi:carbon-nitrogen hydrolase family protein [Amnibacterium kyonggiense]|uniref:Putative amidohydrolase n=1 Tax=Amnibacterium kyonggiense TaxID=595671 RepID=A0A4V3EAD5_9MICO|nr:carbon-nitrogen hydrolase family protein [Amnibacterium kyonggiense]TDS75948.1 putative amidohydrolase [Amnibacterium kyonggiense]
MIRVAVAQFAPGVDTAANLDAVRDLIAKAAGQGADLVVLPEYASFFEHRMGPRFAEHAQPLDGPFTAGVQEAAAAAGVVAVFGLVETASGERFRNTAVAVSGEGVVATYRKTHLYDAFGATESRWVEPGALEPPETFLVGDLRVGLQTCYDLRFPEVTRVLADAEVDLVLVPSDWVPGPGKVHHWRTLLTARAIENTAFVAAAGQIPPEGVGTSLIVGPSGETLAELGEDRAVAVADLDPARVREVRAANPALRLRRYTVLPR